MMHKTLITGETTKQIKPGPQRDYATELLCTLDYLPISVLYPGEEISQHFEPLDLEVFLLHYLS